MNRIDRAFIRAHRTDALTKQKGRCKYCKEKLSQKTATADHVIPRKHGGVDHGYNIAAADRRCNKAKGHMSEMQFMRQVQDPAPGSHLEIWLAHSRYRINKAAMRAERRILASVGLKP
ncbi:HNH endonuclease [Hoeflea sp. TYP-13]|uniref:HNH endonuclease n=1 Tax=Hoeflea sp. TYP-13 TaxID=3230023 RepID=UPI0034C6D7AA